MQHRFVLAGSWAVFLIGIAGSAEARAAETPSVKLALSFRPVQKDVEYETPTDAEFEHCTVKVERSGKTSGWVVIGAAGQALRRFIDTNNDNVVDQWRYYNRGLEVYRDIDSNFNNKVDQSRWYNTGGSRWGLDTNEDGRIDAWKRISPEEATREAVQAMITNDAARMAALLVTREDIETLGIEKAVADKLLDSVAKAPEKIRTRLANSDVLTSDTVWMRFDGSFPSVVPAEDGKAAQDLLVYENVMAFVETRKKPGLIQVGELIRVGDAWKLTQIPRPLEGETLQVTEGGILMQPTLASIGAASGGTVSPEAQPLLDELRALDADSPAPNAGRDALATYNSKRADLLNKLIAVSATDEERVQWTRQMVDGIAAAVQTGAYPDGLKRLESLEKSTRRDDAKSPLVPYIAYRRILSEYSLQLQQADSDARSDLQEWWVKQLEEFVTAYPGAEDSADAMLQLAITQEFAGQLDAAKKWYGKLVSQSPQSPSGVRAAGALRRLDLNGKQLAFSGSGLTGGTIDLGAYRGKTLLVIFWATWCQPCTEDLPQIRALYEKHRQQDFEVVGINLDSAPEPIRPYLTQHRVPWPQIYEPGGLESEPARAFGIISLPTMFLVDKTGKVINRSAAVDDLKDELPALLKK